MRVLVEVLDESVDVDGQLGVGIARAVDDQPERRDQAQEAAVQDLVIQATFVVEVVVDEGLVDARAAGDAANSSMAALRMRPRVSLLALLRGRAIN
jgi:hypothetical protein